MAAGLGFKTFETGDVLTAGDTNGYLMQGVLVFASAAARDAAITSPQEGQFAYLKDTNVTMYYTGSAWANLDTTGMTNPMTTTGDTIYSSSGSTPARLGIGSTGQVLTVASGVPSWATPSAGSNEAVGYKYSLWQPTNTTGTQTNAGGGTSSGNTTNISVSNSSGTLTATLGATGFYLVNASMFVANASIYDYEEMRLTFGGTATLYVDTTNPMSQWGEGDNDGNMTLTAAFLVNATSINQTVTILPDCRIGGGSGPTTQYDFWANVAIVRM
jgi:hypothetical protein